MIILQEEKNTITINGTTYQKSELNGNPATIEVQVVDENNSQCTATRQISVYKCDLSNITQYTANIDSGAPSTYTFGNTVSILDGSTFTVENINGAEGMDIVYSPSHTITVNSSFGPQSIQITITDGNGCRTNRTINFYVQPNQSDPDGGTYDPTSPGTTFP